MCPTIVHFPAVDRNVNGGRGGNDRWGDNSNSSERRCPSSLMSAMITGRTGSQLAEAFLVAEFEVGLEHFERPCCDGAEPKLFCGGGKEASFLDHGKRKSDYSDIGNRDLAECSHALNIRNLGPEILNGVVKIPWV